MNVGLVTGRLDAERAAGAADERRLARAELAGDRDDVAGARAPAASRAPSASVSSARGASRPTTLVSVAARAASEEAELNRLGRLRGLGRRLARRRDRRPAARRPTRPSSSGSRAEVGLEHVEHPRRVERGRRMEERVEQHARAAEDDLLLAAVHRVIPTGLPESSFVAKLPSVATTFGRISSICRKRWLSQASISSGCGSRLPGGRHLRTFAT